MSTPERVAQLTRIAYNLQEAAAQVAVGSEYLRREVHAGRLRAKVIGRNRLLIRREDLAEWAASLPDA